MPKTEDQRPKAKNRIISVFCVVTIVAVYLFGLNLLPLLGPDEPRYAQVAREMWERNDFITPTLGGFHWFEKPALLYWLIMLGYSVFGVSELAARSGSAVFGLLTIFSIYCLCEFCAAETRRRKGILNNKAVLTNPEQVTDEAQRTNSNFAFLTALLLASSAGIFVFSRAASFDIILTFPVTAALVCFFIADEKTATATKQQRTQNSFLSFFPVSRFLFTVYFFIGIALLAKGLVGIVLPFGIIVFYYLLRRRFPPATFFLSLLWGTLVTLAVACAWYLPMYSRHGFEFVNEFFIQHHFARYASNKYAHPQPIYFFWIVLPLMTLPWLPFFFAALWNFFKVQSPKSKAQSPNARFGNSNTSPRLPVSPSPRHNLKIFAFAWLLVPLVFFSFSGSKLPGYILPALPGAMLLTTDYVADFVQKSKLRQRLVYSLAVSVFVGVTITLTFFGERLTRRESVKSLIETANKRGFTTQPVVNFRDLSHSLEFYAANRLVRDADGRQTRFERVEEIIEQASRQPNKTVLVLVPLDKIEQLTADARLQTEFLAENDEFALLAAQVR